MNQLASAGQDRGLPPPPSVPQGQVSDKGMLLRREADSQVKQGKTQRAPPYLWQSR